MLQRAEDTAEKVEARPARDSVQQLNPVDVLRSMRDDAQRNVGAKPSQVKTVRCTKYLACGFGVKCWRRWLCWVCLLCTDGI